MIMKNEDGQKGKIILVTDRLGSFYLNGAQVIATAIIRELAGSFDLTVVVRDIFSDIQSFDVTVIRIDLTCSNVVELLSSVMNDDVCLIYNLGATSFSCEITNALISMNKAIPFINHFQLILPEYARLEEWGGDEIAHIREHCLFLAEKAICNIFPSHSELGVATRLGWQIYRTKNYVIPNAYVPVPKSNLEDSKVSRKNFEFIAVGRFSDYVKGGDLVYRAFSRVFKKFPDCRLTIVSDSPRFSELLFDLPDNVWSYYAWLTRTEVLSKMKQSDVVIIPSRYEPFGLVCVEAMALGKPVIAQATGGLVEIVHHKKTGWLCDPREGSRGIENAMIEAFNSKEKLESMGKAAQGRVEEKFRFSHMIIEIRVLLENILYTQKVY